MQSPSIEPSSSEPSYVPYYSRRSIDSAGEGAELWSESSIDRAGLKSPLKKKSDLFDLFRLFGEQVNRNGLRLVPITEANSGVLGLRTHSTSRHKLNQEKEYSTSSEGKTSKAEQFAQQKNMDFVLGLLQALHESDVDAVKYLLDNGPEPNFLLVADGHFLEKRLIPLHEAVVRSLESTKLLLGYKAQVDITTSFSGTALQRVVTMYRDALTFRNLVDNLQ